MGLFCHGNTEELALKREIFAMPAWGRVIISDFTKIGTPGGLLFVDSSNLTTNVEQCLVITDDIHDEKFKHEEGINYNKRSLERFETQVRLLQNTYEVHVEQVHYVVFTGSYEKKKEEKQNHYVLENCKFIEKPSNYLLELVKKENLSEDLIFRIHITQEDKPQISNEDMKDFEDKFSKGFVDISFSLKDNSLSNKVEHVNLYWDPQGKAERLWVPEIAS